MSKKIKSFVKCDLCLVSEIQIVATLTGGNTADDWLLDAKGFDVCPRCLFAIERAIEREITVEIMEMVAKRESRRISLGLDNFSRGKGGDY